MDKATIVTTKQDLAVAFAEWERRHREEPERFYTEAETLADSPQDYGEACAPYLIALLNGEV